MDPNQEVIRFNRRPPPLLFFGGIAMAGLGVTALWQAIADTGSANGQSHDLGVGGRVLLWILGVPLSVAGVACLVMALGFAVAGAALKFTADALVSDSRGNIGLTVPWPEITAARLQNQGPKRTRLQVLVPDPGFPAKSPGMAAFHKQVGDKGVWYEFPYDVNAKTRRRIVELFRERRPGLLGSSKAGPG
jgi:hypothetical protein